MSIISSGEEFKKARQKDIEHPVFTRIMLKLAAEENNLRGESIRSVISVTRTFLPIYKFAFKELKGERPTRVEMSLPTAVAETFAYRLSRLAGFNHVPPTKLSATEPTAFDNFVKERNGVWIVSQRIPKTLPLYFLSKKIATIPEYKTHRIHKLVSDFTSGIDDWVRESFITALDKRCPVNREHYNDFTKDMESAQVLSAAMWNSPQRLFTYAFSSFLHSTHPHSSNVLVDADGLLWQIDFEKFVFSENATDIAELYGVVKDSEKVMRACREISAISEEIIESALAGIEKSYWQSEDSIIRDQKTAIKYFFHRLRTWKHFFKPIQKQARKHEFVSTSNQNAYRQHAVLQT